MTEPPAPERIAVIWSPEARADLRAIDRETAMQILHCVDRYLASRTVDVKKLKPSAHRLPSPLWRLPRVLRSPGREHHHGHRHPQSQRRLPLTDAIGRFETDSDLFPEVVLDSLAVLRPLVFLFGGPA
jgi:hypothetical protein